MNLIFERLTVADSITFEGNGLHSGVPVSATVHPGTEGIAFRSGSSRWMAAPHEVTETVRCSRLGSIATIEHLMSAFAGLGITDAEVEVTGGEMPAAGGSALLFVDGLKSVGMASIGELEVTPPFARVFLKSEQHSLAIGAGSGHWRYDFVTSECWPGRQSFEAQLTPELYTASIAPARTFVFEDELAGVQLAGLGQGLDERSALILGQVGYVNASLFPDEAARHKLLDLIGDLYLSGVPIQAVDVIAERSGHTANVEAAAKLALASTVVRR